MTALIFLLILIPLIAFIILVIILNRTAGQQKLIESLYDRIKSLYDIRNIPHGGKIAAFILLGVLLLTVSFMYQRLKKIIIDDAENNTVTG